MRYIIRMVNGYALRFENRQFKAVPDAEATTFETLAEALRTANDHLLRPEHVTFESLDHPGAPIAELNYFLGQMQQTKGGRSAAKAINEKGPGYDVDR